MKYQKWVAIAMLLIAMSGCTARLPAPVAPTVTPTASATVTPSATPTTGATLAPLPTATPQPVSAQQPFSTTLQIPQNTGSAREEEVSGLLYLPADYGRDAQRQLAADRLLAWFG